MRTSWGANCNLADRRLGAPGARAQARSAHRSRRSARVHRHLHRHPRAVRHQQRERLVRGLDDPRPARGPGRRSRRAADTRRSARSPPDGRQAAGQRWAAATTSRRATIFTVDGNAPHFPSPSDHFPDKVTNVVPIQLSMGAYNALPAVGRAQLLGVQLHDQLDPPALRAAVHRRLPRPSRDRSRPTPIGTARSDGSSRSFRATDPARTWSARTP